MEGLVLPRGVRRCCSAEGITQSLAGEQELARQGRGRRQSSVRQGKLARRGLVLSGY